jgi:Protein of unknown function (DUF2442)
MIDDLAASIAEAERRGKRSLRSEPRARTARYDRKTGRVLVELTNGCSFAFPAKRAEGLNEANDEELSDIEILGAGLGLHWEQLDVDLSVPGLLAGIFGTKAYVDRQRAARAGAATRAKPLRPENREKVRRRECALCPRFFTPQSR